MEFLFTDMNIVQTHLGSQQPYGAAQQVRQPVYSSAM